MTNYRTGLCEHLALYKRSRLGVEEHGTFRGRPYAHILPARLQFLNFLEPHREALQSHCQVQRPFSLHRDFHHLNSSQAFALNLFFPYFLAGGGEAKALSASLGVDGDVSQWEFEHVPDAVEGTNADVMWQIGDASVFCEVKLSEAKFGTATNDERHRDKLAKIYRPRLESIVPAPLLEGRAFFANYQILRNVWLIAEDSRHQLVFLMPRANKGLDRPLRQVLDGVAARARDRIKIAYVEDCLDSLARSNILRADLRDCAVQLADKYLPRGVG